MSSPLHFSYPIPSDVETAYAAISSAAWPQRKDEMLSDGSVLEEREELADGGVRMRCSRGLPKGIPGFLEKLIPKDGRAGQTDTWGPALADGTRAGSWVGSVPGAPVEVSGTMQLVPAGAGCSYVIDGTAKVKIPLVGGKAEKFVVDMARTATSQEADVLTAMVTAS